ncbi:MAG: molybdopterin converting factor subunit 1 [Rhodospirillaceae bacterium]|nr:molybdopterin converting factor subunit 1 [Rhodospirillaceae bacterium]|tara:strand:+ start:1582 stop:1833 length:252 start_codon:yes stop_codon:yes gene_type:complete
MKLLYFAWVRQQTGVTEEYVNPPNEVNNVATLIDWLRERGPQYARAFEDVSTLRVAINHELVDFDAKLSEDDEVALFPPVTGG